MKNINKETVGTSNFVKRQTKESSFSYFDGTWEELEKMTQTYYDKGSIEEGYRDGVVLVNITKEEDIKRFKSSLVEIKETDVFEEVFEKRQEGEKPLKKSYIINRDKEDAKFVKVVLYRWDVLAEDDDRSTEDTWEIISINAQMIENVPMNPTAMARNFLHLEGGTKADYTAEEFAKAIIFWKSHATTIGNRG